MMPPVFRFPFRRAAGLLFVGAWLAFGATPAARAQRDDSPDAAFNPSLSSFTQAVVQQSDGKILAGGFFTQANGIARTGLARFNANGTLDTAFNPNLASASPNDRTGVQGLAVQTDGKIVVVGDFVYVNGATHRHVARLNADGSVDAGFNPDSDYTIYSVGVQTDGKLLIVGTFGYLNDVDTPYDLARLNANGTTDTTFRPDVDQVDCIAIQSDGRILAGDSYTYQNKQYYDVVRLNADGTTDLTFNPTLDGFAYALAVQTDGKILVGGNFYTVSGTGHRCLARLNADGSTDEAFNPSIDPQNDAGAVFDVVLQLDGKIVAGGDFTQANGLTRRNVARFLANGSVDTNFVADTDGIVADLARQPDNKILLAGGFAQTSGATHTRLARLSGGQRPAFLANAVPLANGVYFLRFVNNGNLFGYFSYLADSHYIYHFDLGYEYVFDAGDGKGGVYLYDFASGSFFYTSPSFPFPYLYDFSLKAILYYYLSPDSKEHYNTNGVRYFYNFATGKIISK